MNWSFERLSHGLWQPDLVGGYFADRGLCGASGNSGLLRFHDDHTGTVAQEFVDMAFGPRGVRAEVFAFDWRATQFAISRNIDIDGNLVDDGRPGTIVTLDPFDMSVSPWGLAVDTFEAALSLPIVEQSLRPDLFDDWRNAKDVDRLTLTQCAGATVPAFYGGQASIDNFALNDVEVYLSFVAQVWAFGQQHPGEPAPHLRTQR
ncbi:hypothetical protein [Gordonia insulae]|uniref:Uncharacterized protein n=1 Tax=Gordonia insulae TaxID=2420509 RepID=A0A3G8JQY6_9ACTN|nr:hypothetical protein [Gordonia insulae]AZG47135.1 hypothetical protein D7316_03743 [Gordonia insulae]